MHILLILLAAAAAALVAWLLPGPHGAILLCALLAALAAYLARVPAPPEPATLSLDDVPLRPETVDIGAVLGAIGDPLLVIDRQRVTHANPPALALLGDHIIDEDVRLAIRHPAAADRLSGRAPDDGGPIEIVGLGTQARRFELSVHPLDGDARLARLVDRTAIHAAERARVDFVANASHELRTPLATLLGFIETLEDRNAAEDAPTRARFLKIMFDEAKRMQRLVDDLMSLSRIEADKYSTPHDLVPFDALVEDVRRAILAGRDLDQTLIRFESRGGHLVSGDRAQLSQLLHNLIGNAIKYGRAGAPIMVTVTTAAPAMVQLIVADQGEGIAPDHLPRITERFYRVDPGRSRALGGTGLGLAIVKHIVERHRGRLQIDSAVGVGTTVTVLLPAVAEPLSSKRHETVTRDASTRPSATSEPAG